MAIPSHPGTGTALGSWGSAGAELPARRGCANKLVGQIVLSVHKPFSFPEVLSLLPGVSIVLKVA